MLPLQGVSLACHENIELAWTAVPVRLSGIIATIPVLWTFNPCVASAISPVDLERMERTLFAVVNPVTQWHATPLKWDICATVGRGCLKYSTYVTGATSRHL